MSDPRPPAPSHGLDGPTTGSRPASAAEADSPDSGVNLARTVARLRLYVGGLALILAALLIVEVVGSDQVTDVLRAERLEIVEPDGNLAFVLANSARPQGMILGGEEFLEGSAEERSMPAFIFFDGKGDEVGGMLFRNEVSEDGFSAGRHLSLDGFGQDQTVVLQHQQDPGGTRAGLGVFDRPQGSLAAGIESLGLELPTSREAMERALMDLPEEERDALWSNHFSAAHRVFVGRGYDGEALLMLNDGQGRPRILLYTPMEGDPVLQFLDADGETIASWPD